MILPITLTIAAAAALIHIWLSFRVSQLRVRHKVSIGDEGNVAVRTRMRAHANYAENMPIVLLLLALLELAGGAAMALWAAGIVFILARILHAFGMDRPSPNKLRVAGILLSWLILLLLAGYAVFMAYQSPALRGGIPVSPMRTAAVPI